MMYIIGTRWTCKGLTRAFKVQYVPSTLGFTDIQVLTAIQLESTFADFLTDLYTGRKKFGKLQKSSSPTTLRRRPQETLSRRART